MRYYAGFKDAIGEIKRELAEMGIPVHTQTMQDKKIGDDPLYGTIELQNYIYQVHEPLKSLPQLEVSQPWADAEFTERISGIPWNPGVAWKYRPEVWTEFLEKTGEFAYTYAERMYTQIPIIIKELLLHQDSRQLYLSIWDPGNDPYFLGERRVPCSLGYLFQMRENKLHITYFMRSCDYITHMQNDIYLAVKLLKFVAEATGFEVGSFTHYIGSLHVYQKDIEGVF